MNNIRRRFAVLCGLLAFVSCIGSWTRAAAPTALEKLVEDYYAVYHAETFDVDKFASFYSEDCEFTDPTFRVNLKGRDQVRKTMADARVGHKDGYWGIKWDINRRFFSGNQAVVEGTWSGNYVTKPFSVRFVTILTVADGKITRQLDFFDILTWSEQVGFLKARAGEPNPVVNLIPKSVSPGSERDSDPKFLDELVRSYYAVYDGNPFDPDKYASFYDDDCVFIDPTFRLDVKGRKAVRAMIAGVGLDKPDGLTDIRWGFNRRLFLGNTALVEGTFSGAFHGKQFSVRFATLLTIRNGKIAAHLDFFDTRTWFEQTKPSN